MKRGEINSISEHNSEKGGDNDLFADVFEEKESPDKLTSIVEKARVAVGNESSTVPLLLNALFLLQEIAVPRSYSDENSVLYIFLHCSSYSQFLHAIFASFCYIVFTGQCHFSDNSSLPKSNQTKRA